MYDRMLSLAAFALLASAASIPAAAGSPSFDCDGVRHSVEKLICADDELAALDLQVAHVLAGVLARAPASQVGRIKSAQSAWRRTLMRCEREPDERACTLAAYQARLGEF